MFLKIIYTFLFFTLFCSSLYAKPFTFSVMTDSHLVVNKDGSYSAFPSTTRIVSDILESKPAFVIHCGDMIHANKKDCSDANVNKMWSCFDTAVVNPLKKAGIPLFITKGNHDVVYGNTASIYSNRWDSKEPDKIKITSGKFNNYYTFEYENCLFIVLDGHALSISEKECDWLAKNIEYGKTKNAVFVITHIGLSGEIRHLNDYMHGRAADILKNAPYKLWILSGHHHVYRMKNYGNAVNIICGCAGTSAPVYFEPIYVKVTVDGKDVRVDPVKK